MIQTLDVALGLSFIFFLFSVLVSTTSEMILSWTNARGKMLWKALCHLLPQSGHGREAQPLHDFVTHPLLAAMRRQTRADECRGRNFPSYLSSTQFSQVLMDLLETKGSARQAETRWEIVQSGIHSLPDAARGSLLALSREAERHLLPGQEPMSVFQFLAGQWFDSMMERTTGWYKRMNQLWNFGVGLVLAVACNLNVIEMTRVLSKDEAVRSSLVQQAAAAVVQRSSPDQRNVDLLQARKDLEEVMRQFSDDGFPVGWNAATARTWQWNWSVIPIFFESLLGWLMAAAAAALGAQFWFDLMKKIINMRGTGSRPEPGLNMAAGEAGMSGPIPPAGYIVDGTESRQG